MIHCIHSSIVDEVYHYVCVLMCSMSGGELFDRIQKKGHFTERGVSSVLYDVVCVEVGFSL